MPGQRWAHRVQLGREATPGTAVAATTILRGNGPMLSDDREVAFPKELIAVAVPTDRSYIPRIIASWPMAQMEATYEQIGHIFEAGIKSVGSGTPDGTGSSGYIYIYEPAYATTINTIKTYTIETGDNQQAEEAEYAFVQSFNIAGRAGEGVMVSANWLARQVTNASFTGSLTLQTVEEILASKGRIYIDAASGTIGATLKSDLLLEFALDLNTGWRFKQTIDGQLYPDFHYYSEEDFGGTLRLVYEHNADSVTERTNWRSQTARLIRLLFTGSTYTTPGTGTTYTSKTFVIDVAGKYESIRQLGEREGNSILESVFRIGHNATAGLAVKITVVNELTAVP